MEDFQAFRRSAIRYWERRRIVYNVALVLPALIGFAVTETVNWVGDPHELHYFFILTLLAVSAVGANICYSFAYGLEFLFASDNPNSRWLRFGRTSALIAGILFAMFLSLLGGYNIAQLHWDWGLRNIG